MGGSSEMGFILRMAWRETRAAWLRLLFFFLCVALGVAAIAVLRSVMQTVRSTLTREARFLVGADVVVQTGRPWSPDQRQRLVATAGADRRGATDVVETQTMAVRARGGVVTATRLVDIRAIESDFPIYGALELTDGQRYTHALVESFGMLVQPALLEQLGVRVGDDILLAGKRFEIHGVVTRDRVQRSSGFALGPRVYVDLADLRTTSLLGFGSRASHQVFLRIDPAAIDAVVARLRRTFRDELVTVRSWRTVEDRLGKNLLLAENYLSLVGFAIVVLGGIGVWSVTRVFVQQKVKIVAVLKCVGATSRLVIATYMLQVLFLAACGSLLGVGLAGAAIAFIPDRWLAPVGVTQLGLTASGAGQAVAVGLLVSALFAILPLLEMRRIKPLLLLRADTEPTARKRDWKSWLSGIVLLAALTLVAIWQADSLRAGVYVSAGLAAIGLVLLGASRLLMRIVAPLSRSRRFALRHAVISLGRPGNQTRVVLMAVGRGCFFILTVRVLQANLVREFTGQVGSNAPDLVLIDVQADQVTGVQKTIAPYVRQPASIWPMMRGRVIGVEGRRVHLPTPDDIRRDGRLTREFGITYRTTLQNNEKLLAGRFWESRLEEATTADGFDTEVSIEENVRDDAKIDVGDILWFDVGAKVLRARVTSVRKVTWDEAQNGGFMFVFRPAPAIDRAPHTFVGFVQVQPGAAATAALERDLVRAFPNVTAIDVREVLSALRDVLDNAMRGVTIVGAVTLFGGVLILIGAVAMTKFQRLYESAIYRTLGASTRMLASMTAIEYGLIGVLAGVLGATGASVLSWVVATKLFEIDWQATPGLLSIGVGLTAIVVSVVGLVASADVLVRKPLGTLRRE